MKLHDEYIATVTRGEKSWAYIYVALGFAIAIEGTIIQLITPLVFPWNVISFLLVSAFSIWLFLFNGWFQNKLIGWKSRYEDKER
jgi:cytochrome b subunit of formate dehydrogenase